MSNTTDYIDTLKKRELILDNPMIKLEDKIKYLNTELKLLRTIVDEEDDINGDVIFANRLQMTTFQLELDCKGQGCIKGHFWVKKEFDETIIDPKFKLYDILAKAHLGTDTDYKLVYREATREIQEENINKWIEPHIKKYRNIINRYKKYKKDPNMPWYDVLNKYYKMESGCCNDNAILNYYKDVSVKKFVYGDMGIQRINELGDGVGDIWWEFEDGFDGRPLGIPKFIHTLNQEEIKILLDVLKYN